MEGHFLLRVVYEDQITFSLVQAATEVLGQFFDGFFTEELWSRDKQIMYILVAYKEHCYQLEIFCSKTILNSIRSFPAVKHEIAVCLF